MDRTPYDDPEAEKAYAGMDVANRNTQMAGSVSNWPYSQSDININRASSAIVQEIKGPNPKPADVIKFPVKKPK